MFRSTRILAVLSLAAVLLAAISITTRPSVADDIAFGAEWPIHLPYPVGQTRKLRRIDGTYLAPAAAKAFSRMVRAARRDGVYIILRSGYRSHAHQSRLFFGGAKKHGVSLAERARVSAPPGYSEHHTGYAVDLDDALTPTYLRRSFDQTSAGQWMMQNAHRFCFELSFPHDNSQGIAYEPWHWRFVGSLHALRVFATARTQYPGPSVSHVVSRADSGKPEVACGGARSDFAEVLVDDEENPKVTQASFR